MVNWERLTKQLEGHGFTVVRFATAAEAAVYINKELTGRTIGMGGSMTLREMGLFESLSAHNTVYWHWSDQGSAAREKAAEAEVYITSVNGLSETGELVNIDGTGNRLAATLYGHREVWFVVGVNKIAPDLEAAIRRARNIAGPKNAQRLGCKTPCAVKGDKCYDCDSPERICNAILTLPRKPGGIGTARIVLVEEELGY